MKMKRPHCAGGGSTLISDVLRQLKKDFLVEFRSRAAVNTALAFAGIITLSISLAAGGTPFSTLVQAVFLWIILFFSAMNGLLHIFTREEEEQTSLFLSLNVQAEAVYLAKLVFNITFFLVIEMVTCPLFIFFLQVTVTDIILFIMTVLSGGLALASAVTMLAAMTARAGGKGSLFTVISFPVVLPVIWVSIGATVESFQGSSGDAWNSVVFLLAFSGAVTAISFLLFRYVWYDE